MLDCKYRNVEYFKNCLTYSTFLLIHIHICSLNKK